MKKFISILLSVMMIMTLAVPAFAVDEEESVPAVCCLGDVNDDGLISADDARRTLRYAVDLEEFTDEQVVWADYNQDGEITSIDARTILRVAVELDEQKPHSGETVAVDATWLKESGNVCADCGRTVVVEDAVVTPAILTQVAAEVNTLAADKGFATLVSVAADTDAAKAEIVIDVDGIWDLEDALAGVSFDGLLTAVKDAVAKYVGDDSVVILDKTVYEDGAFQNTAVKNVLFEAGAGLFYKIANLDETLVFGTYGVAVGEESFDLVVKVAGSDENIAKVKSFADTIAKHIAASVENNNLVIDIKAPDALVNTIKNMGGEDAEAKLADFTIESGLSLVAQQDLDNIFGSQTSAVNRLCAVLLKLDGFVNKVLAKVEYAKVAVGEEKIDIFNGEEFYVDDESTEPVLVQLITGVLDVMSDALKATTVGAFANDKGYYTLTVDVAVDLGNVGMEHAVVEETIIVNIHVFDDVNLG